VDEQSGGNKFVQLTLQSALRYAEEVVGEEGIKGNLGSGVEIVVLADNDFYSQADKVRLPFPLSSSGSVLLAIY